MELHTTTFDRALHFVIFVVGAGAFGLGALAVLERLADRTRQTISTTWVVIAVGVLVALVIFERMYHVLR